MLCPAAPEIKMPATNHRVGNFTRCDWVMDELHRFLREVEEFERGPVDPNMFIPVMSFLPDPMPTYETRTIIMREYEALKRRSDAFLPLVQTLARALELVWNREMARMNALEMLDAITDLKRSKR